MIKKALTFSLMFGLLSGLTVLNAATIKGKVTLLPDGKPYTKGSILLRPIEEEYYMLLPNILVE